MKKYVNNIARYVNVIFNCVFLFLKRFNIVKGIYEPTDAEAKCTFDEADVCLDDSPSKYIYFYL